MWLDRLAGSQANSPGPATPQTSARRHSPLPTQRTPNTITPYTTSQRQGQPPTSRGSTLSPLSNDSAPSLLVRKPNGFGPRHTSPPSERTIDAVEILDRLLGLDGMDGEGPRDHTRDVSVTENDLMLEAVFDGLSLRELAAASVNSDGDSDAPAVALRSAQTMEEYEKDRSKFVDLHRSISACDDVLNSVEINLTNFRNDLSTVSADIESLQLRSSVLNRRLENRKAVEKALGPLVEELSVSPEIISKIATGPIDESWSKILMDVDKRASAHQKRSGEAQQSKASEELAPILEKLVLKAVERIRDFLVVQIKALRSPHINAQIIQQQKFLKFKDLYLFLHKHHATLAEEISLAYMNTMRWYYVNQFGRYERALAKLKLHLLDKYDLLGHEESTRKTAVLSGTRVAGPPHDAFNLGRRIDTLRTKNSSAISSYLAEEDQSTHYLEVPFRNFNLALIDNATAEYTFLATFFSPAVSYSNISKNFNYIFEPTFEIGRTLSKTLVGDSFDALGLLLCIRLNQQFAFDLQRRKVPAVDGYINGMNMLLWPRLQVIMDRHCESVRQLAPGGTKPGWSAGDQAKLSAAPHMVTQRFAQLLHSLLSLSAEAGDDEPVVASLWRLQAEVEAFLARQSQAYGSDKRKSNRFLYNNFSLILTIIGDATGKLAWEEQAHFEDLKKQYQEGS